MRTRASHSIAIALLVGLPVLVLAAASQEPAPQAPPKVFSSKSEVVLVHVSVRDRKSRLVPGLSREAFSVFENGQPQALEFFENEDRPVTAGLVIDSSGSMQRKRDEVIAAGLAFAKSSHPDDELFTVNFNEQVWKGLPPSVPFTTDIDQLRGALMRSGARGQTALFDAIKVALEQLRQGHEEKKVLIVVSDGGDNASQTTYADILDMALRMDAVIYTVGVYDEYEQDAKPELLKKLAQATGGAAFFPDDSSETTHILERVAAEIRSGYTLGYVPTVATPGFHAIRVEVHTGDGRKLTVRARSGYVAGTASASR